MALFRALAILFADSQIIFFDTTEDFANVLTMIGGYCLLPAVTIVALWLNGRGACGGADRSTDKPANSAKTGTLAWYLVLALLAGFCGILSATRFGAGDPLYGYSLEMHVLSAVILGGTVFARHANIAGGVLAAFSLVAIQQLMRMNGSREHWIQFAVSSLVLLALALTYGIDAVVKRVCSKTCAMSRTSGETRRGMRWFGLIMAPFGGVAVIASLILGGALPLIVWSAVCIAGIAIVALYPREQKESE
jgi:ribose/xylose/arabinose/galactoside ABC-type transport system permease subunit